jgi:drug/metabolite transporter (DMT)-like permease
MPTEVVTLLYGLSSALTWGAGDFSGGLASKRTHVLVVVLLAQCIGTLSLLGVALGTAAPLPPVSDLFLAAVAGIGGIVGLVAFYHGLARYQMGPVASVTAAISALVPIGVGVCLEGVPITLDLLGFALAITAVWMITRTATSRAVQIRSLTSSLIAGLGFATFFIAIGLASRTSALWIVVGGRCAALILLATVMSLMRRRWQNPAPRQLPLIALAGLFDTAGNTFYALAASTGRLDTAVVLASLYPATTVLLAWALLKERLPPRQWLGILTALCAVVLLAL